MRALVIEDDLLVAWLLRDLLEELGFDSADLVATEDDAVAAALQYHPDLITADLRLRAGDGFSAIQRICANGKRIPVIYVTANHDRLAGAPFAVVLDKPFSRAALARAVVLARAEVLVNLENDSNERRTGADA